ncbi:hypothetical protein BDF21DRAFT_405110 [Thamnidium elegans]|nr:hypothetical protein BDF21DRAFT_405110 [Thamnidium elegans]
MNLSEYLLAAITVLLVLYGILTIRFSIKFHHFFKMAGMADELNVSLYSKASNTNIMSGVKLEQGFNLRGVHGISDNVERDTLCTLIKCVSKQFLDLNFIWLGIRTQSDFEESKPKEHFK